MQSSTIYCDACGAANRPQARFCIACGQAMPSPSSLPLTAQAASVVSSAAPTIPPGSTPGSPSLTGLLPAHSLLKQRYLILSRLGLGGMGAVYKAADTHLGNRLVAAKEMGQKGLDPQEVGSAAAAFKHEAHLLASLPHHPQLPSMYDHFEDGGRWYLVMDFIAGETLAEYVDQTGGTLPPEEVLDIGLQLTTVLEFLHRQQPPIIFRDLKPANVMRTPDGKLFLIDFGIARHFKAGQARDTVAFGSAGYAAPEQYGKTQTTAQSDIYSLGATLHSLLTGLDPAESPFAFAPLSSPPFSADLAKLVASMVKTEIRQRPARVAEVEEELRTIAASMAASPAGTPNAPTPSPAHPAAPAPKLAQPTQSKPAFPILAQIAQKTLALSGPATPSPARATPWQNASSPGTILCSLDTGQKVFITSLSWSPNGERLASAGTNVQVWDVASGRELLTFDGHNEKGVRVVAWSPDKTRVASAGLDRVVYIWSARTGGVLVAYEFSQRFFDHLNDVAWSPDSTRMATCGSTPLDQNVHIWNASNGSSITSFKWGHPTTESPPAHAVSWSPDNQSIAVGYGDGSVDWWKIAQTKKVFSSIIPQIAWEKSQKVNNVAWSPDGKWIAASSEKIVAILDAHTAGKLGLIYKGHSVNVESLAWSPDSRRIVSGSSDSTVRVWNAANGDDVYTFRGHFHAVGAVAWSPLGTCIASVDRSNVVKLWQAP